MPFLSAQEAFDRFRRLGQNSSHFVWLLDNLRIFEAQNGWVFAFSQQGPVTLLALEPLIPGAPTQYTAEHRIQFEKAWADFQQEVRPEITAFVAVYSPFAELLKAFGFTSARIGHEPWMNLDRCIPRGNAGKGVRSARNQALRNGLRVEEVGAAHLDPGTSARTEMERLFECWNQGKLIQLKGFLNATDPFAHRECRRYFVARNSSNECEGYLIATPVPGIKSYFLEDLVVHRNASKGAGELLTLEAMVALREGGALSASLGVISVLGAQKLTDENSALPLLIRSLMITVPSFARRLYNFDGLETFRKRFNPETWKDVHLCVRTEPRFRKSPTTAWLLVLLAILRAFRPRLRFSFSWLFQSLTSPLKRLPVTWTVGIVTTVLFATVNHFGDLPKWALRQFAFDPGAPLIEWLHRSITSDFFYFDRYHYLFCALPLLALIAWAEKTHTRRFVITFIACTSVLDDFLNFALIVKPFQYFQPHVFERLVSVTDVGGSLWLANLLGLQLCKFGKNREILFASLCLVSVFGFVYSSDHMKELVLNLNHFLFLTIGYITGKVLFELERQQSRRVAKGKPPKGKCVLPSDTLTTFKA